MDVTRIKLKHTVEVYIELRGYRSVEETTTCTCRGHILSSDVERYAIRKVAKRLGISRYMLIDAAAKITGSELVPNASNEGPELATVPLD